MGRQPMDLADRAWTRSSRLRSRPEARCCTTEQADVLMYAATARRVRGHRHLIGPAARAVPGTGHFSESWALQTEALGCKVLRTPWVEGRPIDVQAVEQAAARRRSDASRGRVSVHTTPPAASPATCRPCRAALDASGHPALFVVDVGGLTRRGAFDMDALRAEVVIGASQKGLMLPPGLASWPSNERARASAEANPMPPFYWDWGRRRDALSYRKKKFCGTPPDEKKTCCSASGLRLPIDLCRRAGTRCLRATQLAGAVHAAVQGLERRRRLELLCQEPTRVRFR